MMALTDRRANSQWCTFVVSLERRADRRSALADHLRGHPWTVEFTSEWSQHEHDGLALAECGLPSDVHLFPWQIESANEWWSRPLKYGEVGCSLAHHAVWERAHLRRADFCVVLEDDAVLPEQFARRVEDLVTEAAAARIQWDLLYLGRFKLNYPDAPATPSLVRPGYSHCSFAYVLTARGVEVCLQQSLRKDIIPVDEFLPALYCDHPRADVRVRFPCSLQAVAADPPLVMQLPKPEGGSDTEATPFVAATCRRMP
jgi:collagen beta-1,O-galactosyltransferase